MMILLILLALMGVDGLIGIPEGTLDDDALLDFTWEPATGTVHHYAVYASINDGEFTLVGTTAIPAIVYTHEPVGDEIIIQVQAVDPWGGTGPMSEPSLPVWRVVQKDTPERAVSE